MIIGWLQSQLSSGNHFQITMRHDLDLWPFDPKINRAHPWLMGSKCMKFHDHRWITESVIVRKLVWRTDRLTDRQTDGQTDGQTECKPIVPSGFTGGGLIKRWYDLPVHPLPCAGGPLLHPPSSSCVPPPAPQLPPVFQLAPPSEVAGPGWDIFWVAAEIKTKR